MIGRSLALLNGIGIVVCDPMFSKYGNILYCRCRMETKGIDGKPTYFDLYGSNQIAKDMNIMCRRGNVLFFEAQLGNKYQIMKNGKKIVRVVFMLTDMKVIKKADMPKRADVSDLEILDIVDPVEMLGTDYGYEENL